MEARRGSTRVVRLGNAERRASGGEAVSAGQLERSWRGGTISRGMGLVDVPSLVVRLSGESGISGYWEGEVQFS